MLFRSGAFGVVAGDPHDIALVLLDQVWILVDQSLAHSRGVLGVDANSLHTALGGDGGGSIRIPAAICGLVGMKVGEKRELYIPANLAYGENSPPGSNIPPNSVLLFDIELLDIKKETKAKK